MKNLLKKLHIMPNQSDDSEGSTSSKGNRLSDGSSPERFSHSRSHHNSDHKPFSLSGWFNSVTNRKSPSPPSSSNVTRGERIEQSDSVSTSELDAALEAARHDSSSGNSRDPDIEEYQIQLALELSAREDPEAVQIEVVQINLGSCPFENTLYGVLTESTSSRMSSLVDQQGAPVSNNISSEAILVSKVANSNMLKLE